MGLRPRRVANLPAALDALEIPAYPCPRQPPAWPLITAIQHIVVMGQNGINPVLYLRTVLVLREHAHLLDIREDLREVGIVDKDGPDVFPRGCHAKRGPQTR